MDSLKNQALPEGVSLDLTIRCGFELTYEAAVPTPATLILKPRLDGWHAVEQEEFRFSPELPVRTFVDVHGNMAQRVIFPPGQTMISHDLLVRVPSVSEQYGAIDDPVPVEELPPAVLCYTLPSRYCDSDRLMDFAFAEFGEVAQGLSRVQAICDWIHHHVEYRWGAGNQHTSASEVIAQRFGVCRDFSHTAIALCRCFNLPARYATGYVPDVAFQDPGTAMDFHAYFQVYIGHRWITYDARFNVPRVGRIQIACGQDAVDGAFATLYGAARLTWFNVWAYQIDPSEVRLGDLVDLSKRLDGTEELRMPGGRVV